MHQYFETSVVLPLDAMLARYTLSSCVRLSCQYNWRTNDNSFRVLFDKIASVTTGRIELVLAWRLPSTYPTLCYKKIWVSQKTGVLPFETLFQTPDLENFATASRSRCQQNSSSSSSTVELVDDTYTTVDESLLFTAGRSTVTL